MHQSFVHLIINKTFFISDLIILNGFVTSLSSSQQFHIYLPGFPSAIRFKRDQSSGRKGIPLFLKVTFPILADKLGFVGSL